MNIFYPQHQINVLWTFLLFGFALGLLYDVFRVKRCMFGSSKWVLFIDDFIFSVISVVSFLFVVFLSNNGIVRWYELFLTLFGFCLYLITLSRLLFPLALKLVKLLLSILRAVGRIVINPIKQLLQFIIYLLQPSFCSFYKQRIIKKMMKIILN